jgi:putative Holliday junction resolvase
MKIIALDIGDVHTGVAHADDLGIIAVPFVTVATAELAAWIERLVQCEPLEVVVVGYPKTMKGTESQQTKSTQVRFEQLGAQFPAIKWVFVDERLTSKDAQRIMRTKKHQDKKKEHAIAAAIILQTYLEQQRWICLD